MVGATSSATAKPSFAVLLLAHGALTMANAILGIGSVVSKIGLKGCNPVLFGLLRESLAAPLLFVMSAAIEGAPARTRDSERCACSLLPQLSRLDAMQFLLAGAMLFGTNLGYIVGVKFLGATAAAIWQSSLPIFTTIIAILVGYESLTVLKAVGVLTAFAGCAFVTLYSPGTHDATENSGDVITSAPTTSEQLTGNTIFLVQVTACGAFFVAEKPLLARWTPLATLAYSYAVASCFMLLAGLIINSTPSLLALVCPDCNGDGWSVPRDAWYAIAYWVLLCSVVAYFLITWGNLHVDASMVGVYFTVQPIAAVLAAILVISLTPSPQYGLAGPGWQDLGVVGIFLGVALLIHDARTRKTTVEYTASEPLRARGAVVESGAGSSADERDATQYRPLPSPPQTPRVGLGTPEVI